MGRRTQFGFAAGYLGGVGIGIFLGSLVPASSPRKIAAPPPPDLTVVKELVTGPAQVTIGFRLPPGRRLRYVQDYRIERDSGVQSVASVEELAFRPARAGRWTLRWQTRSFTVTAPPAAHSALARSLRLTSRQPLQIRVSAMGGATALLNAAALRRAAERITGGTAGSAQRDLSEIPAEARDAARRAIADRARTRAQDMGSFAETLLETPRLLLRGFGTLVPGKTVAGKIDLPSGVDPMRVRYSTQTLLRTVVPGRSAEVIVSATADPADARRVMAALLDPVLAAIPDAAQREAARVRIGEMGEPMIREDSVAIFDLPSGLPRTVTWRKRLFIPGRGTIIETRVFKRVR